MFSQEQKAQVAVVFSRNAATRGSMIVYQSLCSLPPADILYYGDRSTENYNRSVIIIEETLAPVKIPVPSADFVSNGSVVGQELIGAGFSCGFFAVSLAAVAGGVAAEVPSGFTSTAVVVAGWVGVTTGGVQCLNGIIRASDAVGRPESNSLQQLDADSRYSGFILIVDSLGVASGLFQMGYSGKKLLDLMMKQPAATARRLTPEALQRMDRAERAATIRRLLQEVEAAPGGKEIVEAAMKEAQVSSAIRNPAIYSTLTTAKASRVASAVDQTLRVSLNQLQAETASVIRSFVKDNWSTPVGIAVNAMPSSTVGSASGSVNYLIHYVQSE